MHPGDVVFGESIRQTEGRVCIRGGVTGGRGSRIYCVGCGSGRNRRKTAIHGGCGLPCHPWQGIAGGPEDIQEPLNPRHNAPNAYPALCLTTFSKNLRCLLFEILYLFVSPITV